mmetsp:Transcript_78801/g.163885  ORF Transcript_78801/g.163885 Transcript_78801/m.163885 type:complete len:223 (+) Transcript_78801:167-835(+)
MLGKPHCSSDDCRSACMQACSGKLAIMRAMASASALAVPFATTRLAKPKFKASFASTALPVRIISIARLWPINRGNRIVPPSINGTPQRLQKTPKIAVSSQIRMSHHTASSKPPATQWPSMAAKTGFLSLSLVGPMGPSSRGSLTSGFRTRFPFLERPSAPTPDESAFRSAPAQKVPPRPYSTATRAVSSFSKFLNASNRAAAVGRFTAFLASGRWKQTVQT